MRPPLRFKNPANGYVVTIENPIALWAFLLGPFFFAIKGMWKPLIFCVVAGCFTLGFSIFVQLIVLPIFARSLFTNHFLMLGWEDVTDVKPESTIASKPAVEPVEPQQTNPSKSLFASKKSGMGVGADGIPTYRL